MRYGTETIRGADVVTFEVLLGPWARDSAAVYFGGRRVGRARVDSFRALDDGVGCDGKRIFYSDGRGNIGDVTYSSGDGFDPARARVVVSEGRTHLISDRVFIISDRLRATRLDPVTFRVLGRGYAGDASGIVWIGRGGPPVPLVDADMPTFIVDARGARDRHGRFVAGKRAAGRLAVETEPDRAKAAERLVESLWRESLASWFADFDRSIPTDDGIVRVGIVGELVTPIPEHRLSISGARLLLEVSGIRCAGSVSGLELLAGFLYGIARGKVIDDGVCVRVALGTDGEIVSNAGAPPRWQLCVDLAYLFDSLGHRQEAAFLVQRIARWPTSGASGSKADDSASIRAELLLPELVNAIPDELLPRGGTTQAAASWLVDNGYQRSTDALVRRDVASSVGRLANQTRVDCGRLARLAEPMVVLLDDPEPAVRAEAAASFDLLASRALNGQAYAEALLWADALAARRINWDVQSARRWLCLAALGRSREADEAWATCTRLTTGDPPRTTTVPRSYATFADWRVSAQHRLGRSRVGR